MQAASPTTKRKALEMLSPNLIETPTHRARGPYVVPLLRRIQLDGSGGQHGWRVCSVLYLGTSQGCWGQLQQGWRHQDHDEVLHLLSELSRIGMLRNSRPCVWYPPPFPLHCSVFPQRKYTLYPDGKGHRGAPRDTCGPGGSRSHARERYEAHSSSEPVCEPRQGSCFHPASGAASSSSTRL